MRPEDRTFVQYAGMAGAGKTELSKAMHRLHGLVPFTVSSLLQSNATNRGRTLVERIDKRAEQDRYLRVLGRDAIFEAILRSNYDRMGIDGLRFPRSAYMLQELGPRSIIVALTCPPEIEHQRILARKKQLGQPTEGYTLEAYLEEQEQDSNSDLEFGLDMPAIMDRADHVIDASQPLEKVIAEASEIVVPLLQK